MALGVTHYNSSTVADAGTPGIIGPNAWNTGASPAEQKARQ
jgi:hypothetical protein